MSIHLDIPLRLLGLFSTTLNMCSQVSLFLAEERASRGRYSSPSTWPAYSPHPTFFFGAFVFQFHLQLLWIMRYPSWRRTLSPDIESSSTESPLLIRHNHTSPQDPSNLVKDISSAFSQQASSSYLPYYIIGNLCMAAWTYAYSNEQLSLGQVILFINCLLQFYAIFFVLKRPEAKDEAPLFAAISPTSVRADALTTLVAKVFAGSTVMYLWKTWGQVDPFHTVTFYLLVSSLSYQTFDTPTRTQQLNTGFCLLLLTIASGPDPTLGIVFIYTLLALFFGKHGNTGWHDFFPVLAVILLAVLILDPICTRFSKKYEESVSREITRDLGSDGGEKTYLPMMHANGLHGYGYSMRELTVISELDEDEYEDEDELVVVERPRPIVPLQVRMTVETEVVVDEVEVGRNGVIVPLFDGDNSDDDEAHRKDEYPSSRAYRCTWV